MKHMDALKEGRLIRNKIKANKKQIKKIEKSTLLWICGNGIFFAFFVLFFFGVIGNTSLKYDDCYNSDDDYTDGFVSSVKVNLNMVRPPEFIKIINNDGVDTDGDGIGDTGGYTFKVTDTSTQGISNGRYWGVEENFGGFFGSTKFYYSETEYFQGTAHQEQTLTTTFVFK